ncbi:MAG: aldo/keto reductase [SAR202 cluster bacterium]|nr:aldo/keto reductase [Dehalococcoidia bacterium]MQF92045.1 aldo/keto reductase [SAR202 cluster bacterium]MQG41828.1 aldo/keto reductase [SAR202 cluster bacterium]MQG44918.1 aldo/keto reductase [SAR202 cluster bacterium]MQG63464.1 aldo/keto reductase [SAR202 cluster bacterium]|tara:strand:+ start:423 stop:1427 length:1005 start_codon:yes stop_codon:yes gene_type:complete
MKFRKLPRTDLVLSEVGFGVWTVATNWWGKIEDADKAALLENAVEEGINFFDTADTYGDGFGEEILATVLGHKRNDIVIATKFGYDIYDPTPRDGHKERAQKFDKEFVKYACEQSLRRLGTDYIDLYQAHNIKLADLEHDELFETLEQLQFEGKIRHYGVALGPDIGWVEEGEYTLTQRQVASAQVIYSIMEQDPAKHFMTLAEENEVGLLSRVPHASNTLTGEFDDGLPTFDADDHRAHRKNEWLEEAMKKVARVRFLVQEDTRTMAQSAIQFVLKQPSIISVLPNFTNLSELKEYTSALETPEISDEEQAKLDELWEHGFDVSEPEPQFREI